MHGAGKSYRFKTDRSNQESALVGSTHRVFSSLSLSLSLCMYVRVLCALHNCAQLCRHRDRCAKVFEQTGLYVKLLILSALIPLSCNCVTEDNVNIPMKPKRNGRDGPWMGTPKHSLSLPLSHWTLHGSL